MKKPGKIRSALLNMLGIPISLTDPNFWSGWGGNNAAGQSVNESTVLSLSAAWACTKLISETIGTLPLHIYERTSDGRRVAKDHPLYSIIHNRPSVDVSASTYWESVVATMLLRGNGLSRKLMLGGRLVGLKFMPWSRLNIQQSGRGNFTVKYIEDDGTQTEIPQAELFHIPGFSMNGRWGISAIEYGASVFGSALASSKAANSTFESGLSSTVAFTTDKTLKKEQRKEFRENLSAISGALHAGKSPLLEGGMDAKVLSISPKDAQLLESRSYGVEEVCRWFGVDPSMVGHGQSVSNWGTGLEQKMIFFLTFTLRPMLSRIEQAINSHLLSPGDQLKYYAEFSIEGLLRADSAARSAFYTAMVNNGIWSRDEVRTKENLPAKGGNAGKLMVHSAMMPIDEVGNGSNNQSERVRNSLENWLNEARENEDSD